MWWFVSADAIDPSHFYDRIANNCFEQWWVHLKAKFYWWWISDLSGYCYGIDSWKDIEFEEKYGMNMTNFSTFSLKIRYLVKKFIAEYWPLLVRAVFLVLLALMGIVMKKTFNKLKKS